MRRKYKLKELEGIYFVSFAVVEWINVFINKPHDAIVRQRGGKVINAYEKTQKAQANTVYLFFMNVPDSQLEGFMPLTGEYGFIFNYRGNPDLLAHELAHGAFNLRHTFSDKAQHYFNKGTTKNLLDYSNSTELWKYQWDLIHNPERIWFSWLEEEEEGASVIDRPGKVRAIIELVRYAYACDKSIKLESGTPSTNNITLGDSHKYGFIGIYIKGDVTISNLKSSFQNYIWIYRNILTPSKTVLN